MVRLGNRTYRPGKNLELPKYLFNLHEVCGTIKRHKLEVYATLRHKLKVYATGKRHKLSRKTLHTPHLDIND